MRRGHTVLAGVVGVTSLLRCRPSMGSLLETLYVLPPGPVSSCSWADAQSLFARCCRPSAGMRHGERCHKHTAEREDSEDAGSIFKRNVTELEKLGMVSVEQSDSQQSHGTQKISRTPVVTVKLYPLDEKSTECQKGNETAFSIFLHGIVVPHLHASAPLDGSLQTSDGSSPPTDLVGTGCSTRAHGELTITALLALLRPPELVSCESCSGFSKFLTDFVNAALKFGVNAGLLSARSNGAFCLNPNATGVITPRLLDLQLWWIHNVEPHVQRRLLNTDNADDKEACSAWVSVAQSRLKGVVLEKNGFVLPHCLNGLLEDDAAELAADAARCWSLGRFCSSNTISSSSAESLGWRVHLSDDLRVTLALDLFRAVKSFLAQRPAGISVSDLSCLISWTAVSSVLEKRSILKTLLNFPAHFSIVNVNGIQVVHEQLNNPPPTNDITEAEVSAWLFCGRSETGPVSSLLLQEMDLVVRAVTFLRKRHLKNVTVTFGELCAVLNPSDAGAGLGNSNRTEEENVLRVLWLYNIVKAPALAKDPVWHSVRRETVRLSEREVRAFRALESARTNSVHFPLLYREAIEPFLACCRKAVTGRSGATLPSSLLYRWMQADRLSLKQKDFDNFLKEADPSLQFAGGALSLSPLNGSADGVLTSRGGMDTSLAPQMSVPPVHREHNFESQLHRVLKAQQLDALSHFAKTAIHAAFDVLLPQLSIPSGLPLQKLLRRLRWGSLAVTLGSAVSFLEAFNGLFFEIYTFSSAGEAADTSGIWVSAYHGHVGPWLLYARLIARLFPSNVDIPLRLVAESLSWGTRFATAFGDLPSLLRLVGRCCQDGYLLAARCPFATPSALRDAWAWELLQRIRQLALERAQLQESSDGPPHCVCLQAAELRQLAHSIEKSGDAFFSGGSDTVGTNQILTAAIRRFPHFMEWHGADAVRVAMPEAAVPAGLIDFVHAYVCPLLRDGKDTTVAEIDSRLGWSCGYFDIHPVGVRAVRGVASAASLAGVLMRYREAFTESRIVLHHRSQTNESRLELDESVVVRPNTSVYRSPEDMLLEVNGLCVAKTGEPHLIPLERPVSLFELIAEEQELWPRSPYLCRTSSSLEGVEHEVKEKTETVVGVREEQERWRVLPLLESSDPKDWPAELDNGGDILVWCEV